MFIALLADENTPNLGRITEKGWEYLIKEFSKNVLVTEKHFIHSVSITVPDHGNTASVLCFLDEREGKFVLRFNLDMYSCTVCYLSDRKKKINFKTDAINEVWQKYLIQMFSEHYQTHLLNYYKLHDMDTKYISKFIKQVNNKRQKGNITKL